MKSTPVRRVKEYLKPCAYKQWENSGQFMKVRLLTVPFDRVPFA